MARRRKYESDVIPPQILLDSLSAERERGPRLVDQGWGDNESPLILETQIEI